LKWSRFMGVLISEIAGTANHDNLRPSKVSRKTLVGSNKELRFRTGEKDGKPKLFTGDR